MYVRLSFGRVFSSCESNTTTLSSTLGVVSIRIFQTFLSTRSITLTHRRPITTHKKGSTPPSSDQHHHRQYHITVSFVLHSRCLLLSKFADLLLIVHSLQATACCCTCVCAVMFCVYVVGCWRAAGLHPARCIEVRLGEMR